MAEKGKFLQRDRENGLDMKIFLLIIIAFLFLATIGPLVVFWSGKVDFKNHWSVADRSSANLAPKANQYEPAVVQVYAARTYNWRGLFAVHTWIAVKGQGALQYTVYQVVGWRQYWGLPVFSEQTDIPDRKWFGNQPTLLVDIRGAAAEALVKKIQAVAESYPYKNQYILWPGPNSNSFTAYIGRSIPELKLLLPSIAIGKDYLGRRKFFARAPSATGYQFSFYGIMGVLFALKEGIEINFLGLVLGVDVLHPAIILPGIGRIGVRGFL